MSHYYESTRVGLQFQYHDQYSIFTQALVLAPENMHISLMNKVETVLTCTEVVKCYYTSVMQGLFGASLS